MNNYHDWTDEDLNTRICLLRGINMYEPQPIRDLRAALDLLKNCGASLTWDIYSIEWEVTIPFQRVRIPIIATHPTNPARAVCEVWLLWKDAEGLQ